MKQRVYLIMVFITSSLFVNAAPVSKHWDFEHGKAGWRFWGTNRNVPKESLQTIVTVTDKQSQSGKHSLVVSDQLSTANPYAVATVKGPFQQDSMYLYSGWLRTDAATACPVRVAIAAEGNNTHLGWLTNRTLQVQDEWRFFSILLEKLPAKTELLRLAIFPTSGKKAKTATGQVFADNISFDEISFTSLALKTAMNRGFKDDTAGDGLGGWTDQGSNDLRGMKGGAYQYAGVPFTIVNPDKNNDQSVIAIKKGAPKGFLDSVSVPVNGNYDYLYLLHTGAWLPNGTDAGTLTFTYTDGTTSSTKLTAGETISDWWSSNATAAKAIALRKVNPTKSPVFIFAAAVKNPQPAKAIKQVTLSASDKPNTIWMVLAMTLGNGPDRIKHHLKSTNTAKRDYRHWKPFVMTNSKSPKALVDLSFLLEAPAGKHGFVTKRNGHFVFANGTPARFWGTNIHANAGIYPSHEQAENIAATLARLGFNIIRFHLTESMTIDDSKPDSTQLVGDDKLEKFDYFVKCLKDKGIYVLIDSVTGLSARKLKPGDKVPGFKAYSAHRPWAYYAPRLIELGKQYMRDFLTRKNRYTGKSLLEEPAVAMLMLINEQSILFDWKEKTYGTPDYYKTLLRQMYNRWLLDKFNDRQTLEKAFARAGRSGLLASEDPVNGTVEPVFPESLNGSPVKQPVPNWELRAANTVAFLKDVQVEYHRQMKAYLQSLGCKIPVTGTNIIYDTAGLETNLDMDYTSQNVYYDHIRWSKDKKTMFMKNIPAVDVNPISGDHTTIAVPIAAVKLASLPVTSTESDMMWPHEWRASYGITMAAAAALQDWDAIFQYCYMGGFGVNWDRADKAERILFPTVEFNDPAIMGVMPAGSIMFHRRDIAPANNLVRVLYSNQDRTTSKIRLRKQTFPFNYLTYVSRVESTFDPSEATDADLVIGDSEAAVMPFNQTAEKTKTAAQRAQELDKTMKANGLLNSQHGLQDKKIVSDTGEVINDWGNSLLLIDTPRSQGFSGFPAKPVTLSTIKINCQSSFATIVVNSLDGQPLADSEKMLLTTVARADNDQDQIMYGEIVESNSGVKRGEQMACKAAKAGTVRVEPVKLTLDLKGAAFKVTPLNPDMTAMMNGAIFETTDSDSTWLGRLFSGDTRKTTLDLSQPASIWYLIERIK